MGRYKAIKLLLSLVLAINLLVLLTLQKVQADGPLPFTHKVVDNNFDSASSVYAADLDGDGKKDMLAASTSEGIAWWRNNGDGTFTTTRSTIDGNYGARDVRAVDLDLDGDMDVLGASQFSNGSIDGYIKWWENDGDGNFSEKIVTTNFSLARSIYVADLNGDDLPDILGGNSHGSVKWWQNNGNDTFTENTSAIFEPVTFLTMVRAADLDGDDDQDVIIRDNNSKIRWRQNDGNGNFFGSIYFLPDNSVNNSLAVGDLDGDNDIDVIGNNVSNSLTWWPNTGSGSFSSTITIDSLFKPTSVYALDLDGDGDVDILAGSRINEKVAWWENNGSGVFTATYTLGTGYKAEGVYAADLEVDGDIDVVGVAYKSDLIPVKQVTWWENTTRQETDLRVEKTGPTQAVPGRAILYNLAVENIGSARAEGVILTDTLPAGVTYLTHSAPVTPTVNGSSLTWNLGDLNIGQRVAFALVGEVAETATPGQTLQNVAEVDALNPDEDLSDNIITATAVAIAPYSHTLSLTPNPITAHLGATETVRLQVANTGPLADAYTVTVAGLSSAWYTPITGSFPLNPGALAITELELHVNNCSAIEGTTPFSVTVYSQESANQAVVTSSLTLLTAPPQLDLVPAGGSKTGSRSQLFSWRTNTPTTGTLTLYPTLTPTQIITRSTSLSPVHQVMVDNLTRNLEYSWRVESRSACGTVTTSPFQNFTVGNGLVFEQHTQAYDIYHDYGQRVTMTVRNEDMLMAHTLRVTVEHPYQDLIVGFVGAGSIDDGPQYLTLPPNASRVITLALHAQDARQVDYDLTAKLTANEGTANEIVDYAHLDVRVLKADDFSLTLVDENPDTLVKTYEVKNLGFPITDLNVQALDPATGLPARALIQPTLDHARLAKAGEPGDTLQFEVIPLFSPDDAIALEALSRMGHGPGLASPLPQVAMGVKVVTRVQNSSQQHQANYSCPAGQQLYAVTLHEVRTSYSNQDWYCTNRPSIDLNFATPGYINPLDILSARVSTGFNPAPGWQVLPHDVRLLMNGNPIGALLNQIPQGNYTFNVDPAFLNPATNPVQPVNQSLGLRTTHLNGGHYVVNTASLLELDVTNLTRYVCAADPQQATGKAGQGTQSINGLFTISGQVQDENQQLIPNMAFRLATGGTSTTIQPSIDAAGNFVLPDNITGTYTLTPIRAGYEFFPISTTVSVPPNASSVNFTGTAVSTITGSVLDVYSNPVTDTLISLTSNLTSTTPLSTVVDAAGLYQFSNLISGTYTLTPTRDSYIFSPISLTLMLPPDASGANFTGTLVSTITGVILDTGSNPLTDTLISVTAKLTSTAPMTTLVDAAGLYTLTNLIGGTYTITPTKERYLFSPISSTVSVPPSILGLNFTGTLPISIEVFAPNGNPVTQLTTNSEGWPTPNPLTATIKVSCPAGGPTCANPLTMTIGSPDNARFFVYDVKEINSPAGLPDLLCAFSPTGTDSSHASYKANCNDNGSSNFSVPAGQDRELNWSVWIQPSEALTLTFAADWANIGADSRSIQVPKAQIRPLVFIPGYLATFPPAFGPEYGGDGKIDPLYKSYDNLLKALERAGYELGEAGSDATLIPFLYDWRQPLGNTGSITLTAHIQLVRNASNQKDYADYSEVDLLSHSTGGLIARAYLENTTINNNQTVHTFVTLGSPHSGVPGSYVGKYGGDPTPVLPAPMFNQFLSAVLYCEEGTIPALLNNYFSPEHYYDYFKDKAPSIADFIPRADHIPQAYLLADTPVGCSNPEYCYGKPPSLFLDDLNTSGGLYNVEKLQQIPRIISSYGSNYPTPIQYRVDPPPTSLPPGQEEFWKFGTAVQVITQATGDLLVPDYSGNLKEVVNYSNIVAYEEPRPPGVTFDPNDPSTFRPTHMGLIQRPHTIRRVISYITDIDVTQEKDFWNIEYVIPNKDEVDGAAMSCSPVRLLATDSLGRRAGLDLDSGAVINEIPGAYVTENGIDPQIIVLPETEGQYRIQGVGIEEGPYKIGWSQGIIPPTLITSFTGTTTIGQSYEFTSSPTLPQETGGQIVLEAEQFAYQSGPNNQAWKRQTTVNGYTGSGYLSTLSDIDLIFTTPLTTTPEVRYTINFSTTGIYYVWLRGQAPNGAGDSVYVSLDNQPATILTGFAPHIWTWAGKQGNSQNTPVIIEIVTPGVHTLRLQQREDGLRIDQILLTTDGNYNPGNSGP